jgi:translocation and assembly module TamA
LLQAALSACALLCACTGTRAASDAPTVKKLEVKGAKVLGEGELKKHVLTTEAPFWPWEEAQPFEPSAWQADLRRIERQYEAAGYYDAKVVSDTVTPAGEGKVALQVEVTEGEPTRIASVAVLGLEPLSREARRSLEDVVELQRGQVFREEAWADARPALRARLAELGYVEATVEGEVEVDVVAHEARVELRVDPGPRYRFGTIFVSTGPTPRVKPARIIEQAEGAVKKGAWYSESALLEAQSRVFKMGVFGAVKVNRGAPDRASGTVPVVVDVREAPFHTLRAGVGLGLDQTRNELRGVAEYTDRNFLGNLRRLTIRGRAGVAFLPSAWAWASRSPTAQSPSPVLSTVAEFEQPRFLLRDVRAQSTVELERGVEPAFRYYGARGRTGVAWQPHPNFSVFPSYNLEAYLFDEGQAQLTGRSPSGAYGCPNPCLVSFLDLTLEWDRRNDKLEPRRGYYLGLNVQSGGNFLGGSFSFTRVMPDARGYVSFGREQEFTLAGRLRVGSLVPSRGAPTDSPIVSRFFSGGPGMRGFNNRRLSPLAATVQLGTQGEELITTVPVGGNGLVEGTVELRYALTKDLLLAAYYDTGLVTQASLPASASSILSQLQHALGVGLRYRTLVGPIRLDVARRLNIGPPLPVIPAVGQVGAVPASSGCFGLFESKSTSFAGSPESPCTLHVSIGEAF